MILAQQFPSCWGNRSLLADLYALSLHELSEHERKGSVNLPLTFSVLIETKSSSFSVFFSNSHNKKWKYYITNTLFLTFTVFIEVRSVTACNFIKKRLQHRCFPVKFVKCLTAPPILKAEEHLRSSTNTY